MMTCRRLLGVAWRLASVAVCAWQIDWAFTKAHADPLSTKTEVQVVFEMPDPRYTDEFADEELPALRAAAGQAIAGALTDKVKFLHFNTNSQASYILVVRLDRAEGSRADGPAEFGLHLILKGPQVRDEANGYVLVRTKDQFLSPIGDAPSLIMELEHAMSRADHSDLVRRVFRHVAIAEKAHLHAEDPLGWIIDRSRALLCLDHDSRLAIENAFPSGLGLLRELFEALVLNADRPDGRIVSRADTSVRPEMIEHLRSTDPVQVEVERVFVREYRRFCPPTPVPAEQVDFSTSEAER